MELNTQITTFSKLLDGLSDQYRPMTIAVIALSAAQAVAVGESCVQISFDNQIDKLDWQAVSRRLSTLARLKHKLADLAQQDFSQSASLRDPNGEKIPHSQSVCDFSLAICRASLDAHHLLSEFQDSVYPDVLADFELILELVRQGAKNGLRAAQAQPCSAAHQTEIAQLTADVQQLSVS